MVFSVGCVRELRPLLGVLGVFGVASGGLYLLAASLSQQLEDGCVTNQLAS